MARNTKEEKKRKVFAKGKRMKQKEETIQKQEEDTFRFDDEIIIGVTKIEETNPSINRSSAKVANCFRRTRSWKKRCSAH